MPELPEIETVRRMLEKHLSGKTVTGFFVGRPTFYRPPPQRALAKLPGSTVKRIKRRGKYLLVDFSGGETLSMHLGMSGSLSLDPTLGGNHIRFELKFAHQVLSFHDPRRFGRVGCALPQLGPEPLDSKFNETYFWKALRGRKAPIKAMLMDQRIVAGLGNIYATEALFQAGIRPGRAAGSLNFAKVARLCAIIKRVLAKAVDLGGSTLEDAAFLDPMGQAGRAQNSLAVYGRKTGSCGHALKATRRPISGRTSRYCPQCQH